MALWNSVQSRFNADDETVNFGARTVAENNGSIYETSTLATIQSDSQVIENPNVSASIQYSMLCVAVDKSITIFSDESCYEIILSVGFDMIITTYSLSKDGEFLFVALENGVMHCLHVESGGKQVFYENIHEKFGGKIVKICLQDVENETNIMLIMASGAIYSIQGFDLKNAHSALKNEDESKLEEIVQRINCMEIFKGSQTIQVVARFLCLKSLAITKENSNPVALHQTLYRNVLFQTKYLGRMFIQTEINLSGKQFTFFAECFDLEFTTSQSSILTLGKHIQLWPSERRCSHFGHLPFEYKKIKFFKNYGAMIGLRNDGILSIICLETLLGKKIWNGPVADFVTVQDKINDPYQILILTVPEKGSATTSLQFLSFPDLECKFEMSVPTTTYLVDLIGCSVENIVFLEGIKNAEERIETIRVKAIVESIPEYRVERLLRREQFEEAEFFAKQFKLNLESVHAAKAAAFINQLGPWTNDTNDAAKLETFVSTLDKIKDVKYIYDCCNNALTSNYKQTRRLLLYARQRIMQHIEQTKNQDFAELLSSLNVTLRKLETFEIIQKTKIDVEDNASEDVEEWIRFSRANLLEECVKHLSLGELEAAAAIWIRHLPELAPIVTPSAVHDILHSITETTAPCKLWPWLWHFLPSVISLLPSSLPEIILWGYKKTKSLEKYHRIEWPQIGLDFAGGLMDLLSSQESHVCSYFHQQNSSKNSHLHRFMILVQAMTDLSDLKTLHRIVIPLETYLGDSTTVIHLLLNKAHVDAIPNLVENFLRQYILNHSLQNDQVFASYVQKILNDSKGWWFWEKAPWEHRVSIVIGYIHNVQNRLRHIVDVLKKAPVPWSDTIIALAESSYKFDHPLVSTIRTEINGVAIKLILKKYGYAHVGLSTRLFRYIIKQDRSDMIDDICELTKADSEMRRKAFCLCTNHHLNKGNINKAMEVLNHVDDEVVHYCCTQIVNVTIAGMSLKERDDWLDHYVEALGSVESRLQKILSQKTGYAFEFNQTLNNIPHLKSIYKLYKQFGISINLAEYLIGKKEVLTNYIDRLINDLDYEKNSMLASCESLEKVSVLLGLPPLAAILELFDKNDDVSILKRSITRIALNGIASKDEARYLSRLCFEWITNAERDPEISILLQKLCAFNFLHCDEDLLQEAALCNNQVNAYVAAIGYDSICEPEPEHRMNLQTTYSLYNIYKDAAVSSGQMLLPLFKDSLRIYNYYTGTQIEEETSMGQEIELLVKSLLDRTKQIQNEHYDYSLLQIMQNLHYSLNSPLLVSPEVMKETNHVLSHCLYTLLKKVVSARSLDLALGLVCLFMLNEKEASKWLSAACRSFQGDLIRHRAVVELGSEYYRIIKHKEQLYDFDCQKLLHRWARKLVDYGISYKEVLTSDLNGRRDILERIMNSGKSNLIPVLTEYCGNFAFNIDDCFLIYLQVLLSSWQPRLNFITSSGRKELIINENDVDELRKKCNEVAAKISDKASMKEHLTKLSPQINFYHYEVFLTMFNLLGEKNLKLMQQFSFLQNYTRHGSPTHIEREEWANLCHENSSLPAIAEWRLPYLPKIDQWKLIAPELNLKTYEKWLNIAPILKLQPHVICTFAVKSSVTEAWKVSTNLRSQNESWCLYPRNSALLKDIKRCIEFLPGPEGLYYGTAALYYVVNYTPQGADQVAAAQECFASAQRWALQSNNDADGLIEKIKEKYLRLTSKHILYTHGLGQEKYLNLIGFPEKLIRELYNDESIPERCKGAIQRRPDINSATNALSSIFSLNIEKIRSDLLLDWLQAESWGGKLNESVTMGFGMSAEVNEDNSIVEDNLLRACYIVGGGQTDLYAIFLIGIGLNNDEDDSYGPGVRFRALRVVQSITDEATLKNLAKKDLKSFRRYMKSLQYINELEVLGLGYSISSFESCSKQKLAQILMKTQYSTPRALSLILQICIDFEVHDHVLLNLTLERMAKHLMVKDLEKYLPVVGTMSNMSNCSGYITGWQLVIASPFGKMDPRPNPKQIADCIGSLRLLHACPVVTKLEFRDIINRCFHCQQPYLAAALLPFLNEKDKDYVLQDIKQNYKINELINDLTALTPKGILVISQSLQMLREIQPSFSAVESELI